MNPSVKLSENRGQIAPRVKTDETMPVIQGRSLINV